MSAEVADVLRNDAVERNHTEVVAAFKDAIIAEEWSA